jgi:hypothetical protein
MMHRVTSVDLDQRFWSRVQKTPCCWLWTGRTRNGRYGDYQAKGRKVLAHRYAYEQLVGPVPDGLELDHVKARGCTSTLCVNPAHLEPVTHLENMRRRTDDRRVFCACGAQITPDNPRVRRKDGRYCRECAPDLRTHCRAGHEYTASNTYIYDGRRTCRICRLTSNRVGRERRLLAQTTL